MNIRFRIKNLKEIREYIESLPRGIKIAAMEAYTEYILGNEKRGLRHEPKEKFVKRSVAYGKVSDAPDGYFSWKQFRYVAWKTKGFTEKYKRTHEMASSWQMTTQNSDWTRVSIENKKEGSEWVFGDNQARQLGLVGWRKYVDVIASNATGAMNAAVRAVEKWLAKK